MYSRLAATVAAGVLVATGLATSATAAAPFTDAVQISNNLDSGTNGSWAWVNHRRSVSVTLTSTGADGQPDTYSVVLTDSGSLRTIKGAKSPQAGVTISDAVGGSFSGRYTFTVTSATAPSGAGVANAYNYACSIGGSCSKPAETSAWPTLYFDGNAKVTANEDWAWTYRTCAETWRNTAGGNSGDITGALCGRRVEADAPTVVQPKCDTTRGQLVVPSDRGVRYEVNGRTWRAGTHPVRPGVYRVHAYARDGYRLAGQDQWRLRVERATACPTPTPTPTVTPTVTVSPTPTVDPVDEVVTPKSPALEQATCDDKTASITVPEVKGVVYKSANGTVLEQGKAYGVNAGNALVTAEAADGYTLADGATSKWTFVVSEAPTDCPTATPTVTKTTSVVVVNNIPVPSRVDTGFGGLAK